MKISFIAIQNFKIGLYKLADILQPKKQLVKQLVPVKRNMQPIKDLLNRQLF